MSVAPAGKDLPSVAGGSRRHMDIVRSVGDLRSRVAAWHDAGERVGLVPTMGALHAGHLSLVRASRRDYDRTIVTLFVNPKQFNAASDLARYPRSEADDAQQVSAAGADLLYAPDLDAMYPAGFATSVSVGGLSEGLCGDYRPGHFDGVATVVAKLFLQSQADGAFFGEKDYQQLAVIERMALDLDLPIRIHACPTVRDPDGVAMASRNRLLAPADRARLPALADAMRHAASAMRDGGQSPARALADAHGRIAAAGFSGIDYIELRAADTLAPMRVLDRPGRILAAAWLAGVRMIDNIPVEPR